MILEQVRAESQVLLQPIGTIDLIKTLHFGEGATIRFCRKSASGLESLGFLSSVELETKLSTLSDYFGGDLYFAQNSSYQQRFATTAPATGLPVYSGKIPHLRWLNVCSVDLDMSHDGQALDFGEAWARIGAFIEANNIPQPNFVCASGRGVWLLWQIRNFKNQSEPVPAFRDCGTQKLLSRINRAIVSKFTAFGADSHSTDAARIMRVPGSLNVKAGKRVEYFTCAAKTYTMPELAAAFGCRARKTELRYQDASHEKNPRRVEAGKLRWTRPLAGFYSLWALRGAFTKGLRSSAVLWLAVLLHKNRASEAEIERECLRLAASCVPPLDRQKALAQIASSKKIMGRVSNPALASHLKITTAEKLALSDWFVSIKARKTRTAYLAGAELRRGRILQAKSDNPALSCRQIATLLGCSKSSVSQVLSEIKCPKSVARYFTPSLNTPVNTLDSNKKTKNSAANTQIKFPVRPSPRQDRSGGNLVVTSCLAAPETSIEAVAR